MEVHEARLMCQEGHFEVVVGEIGLGTEEELFALIRGGLKGQPIGLDNILNIDPSDLTTSWGNTANHDLLATVWE